MSRSHGATQAQLRSGTRALQDAKDEAAQQVAHARDAAAREVRDADSRARARAEQEHSELRSQLAAERAALNEERALLERTKTAADTLAALSARVEVAGAAAVEREERLAHRLESDLAERERRCARFLSGNMSAQGLRCRCKPLHAMDHTLFDDECLAVPRQLHCVKQCCCAGALRVSLRSAIARRLLRQQRRTLSCCVLTLQSSRVAWLTLRMQAQPQRQQSGNGRSGRQRGLTLQ